MHFMFIMVECQCAMVKMYSLLWPGASQWRIDYHCLWGQLSTTCNNATEVAHWQLPVAVDHNQLQTMASETVDPIDRPSQWL